ncbi:ROK family protein [Sulfurimonas sp.]|uniref:ROK family protein n=1 Tax=Sulfurimonas sp. TaxID=2022749 RepID=UPI0025FD856F|nr:ROK family protein [Sulfurimonas sp.]MDD5157026.1 ROK family protein [Sulfurimonas sp.]
MKKLFIDVGGTYLRSEIYSDGVVLQEKIKTDSTGLMQYIDTIIMAHNDIEFIGISYAGQVDGGVIIAAPNIHIDEYEIMHRVKERYGVELKIDNDLNCAIFAEAEYWKSDNIALLFVGTGIGSAVIDNKKLVRGSRNISYEIGHIPYRKAPFFCGCGRNNCIELYSSGSAMAKWLNYYGSNKLSNLTELKNSQIKEERQVAENFEQGLLYAIGTLITISNPEIVVLGGGVIAQNSYLIDFIKENIKNYALGPSLESLRIEQSFLENASLEGAKLLGKIYE